MLAMSLYHAEVWRKSQNGATDEVSLDHFKIRILNRLGTSRSPYLDKRVVWTTRNMYENECEGWFL